MLKSCKDAVFSILVALLTLTALLALSLLFATLGRSQNVEVAGNGPIYTLGRGLTWTGSGGTSINQTFDFTPQRPADGFCLILANHGTGTNSVVYYPTETPDPSVRSNTNPVLANSTTYIASNIVEGTGTATVTGAGMQPVAFFTTMIASRAAINFSTGNGSGTVDAFIVEMRDRGGCNIAGVGNYSGSAVAIEGLPQQSSTSYIPRPVFIGGWTPNGGISPINTDASGNLLAKPTGVTCTNYTKLPTALTSVVTGAHFLTNVWLINPTGAAATFNLEDSSGNPLWPTNFSIASGSFVLNNFFPEGIQTNGLQWSQATANAIGGYLCYY